MELTEDAYFPGFCRSIFKQIRDYLADEEHKKEFEDWYKEQYGKDYVWKYAGTEQLQRSETVG